MTSEQLEKLHLELQEEVTKRRRLGFYNADGEIILKLTESMLQVVHHIRETAARKKPK